MYRGKPGGLSRFGVSRIGVSRCGVSRDGVSGTDPVHYSLFMNTNNVMHRSFDHINTRICK